MDHCQNSLPHPVQPSLGREVGRGPVTRRPFVLPAFCSRNSPFLTGSLLLTGLIGIPSHPQGPRPGGLGTGGRVGQPHTPHPECRQTLASTSDPGPIPAWERTARDQKSEIRWSLAFLRAFPAAKLLGHSPSPGVGGFTIPSQPPLLPVRTPSSHMQEGEDYRHSKTQFKS